MSKAKQIVLRWLPALLVMLMIFLFSARTRAELPDFHTADRIVKKGAHMAGYAFLAAAYWRAFDFRQKRWWLAWGMAVMYAMTDEFHQSFVPGRSPSIWDVLLFDNLGALVSLCLLRLYKTPRSGSPSLIVEKGKRRG
ncbi:MAG TPA: VanZ family protein [Anaerolineales bacterium]|jgi:VanZ family protein|nr:VanZ family protein [Anaerolineales bacterium]